MRDYGLDATVWDGDPECEHVWGEESRIIKGGKNKVDNMPNVGANAYLQTTDLRGKGASQAQFCQLCGAWFGCLGLEPSPELYVKHIVDIFREVRRTLRDDGVVFINIGDSYAANRGSGAKSVGDKQATNIGSLLGRLTVPSGLKPKDLVGIPFRLFLDLQADGWVMRSDIIWSKTNPMPESVTDRPTKAHEYIFMMAKSNNATFWTHRDHAGSRTKPQPDYRWWDNKDQVELDLEPDNWRDEEIVIDGKKQKRYRKYNLWKGHDYYYDQDAIREDSQANDESRKRAEYGRYDAGTAKLKGGKGYKPDYLNTENGYYNAGRNKRTVWTISTKPYPEAHFATFPERLVEPMVLAGSPERCCPHCGAGWKRVVEATGGLLGRSWHDHDRDNTVGARMKKELRREKDEKAYRRKTLGWQPTCSCENNDGSGKAIVLDPFAGSGTTCAVAKKHGRAYVGIEQNPDYCLLCEKRIAETEVAQEEDDSQLRLF